MIEIISGEKGKGKTKYLLDKVKADVKTAEGSIVFVDKDDKHMFGVDPKVRLINFSEYKFGMENIDEFIGFICGVISQNNDIEEIFIDSFLKVCSIDTNEGLIFAVDKLTKIANQFHISFIISISKNEMDIPEELRKYITVSL
ncbi:MAG: twitching motility protein PilT [Lachnospiraceae bacterium]|nr:twitching motility protein PilT [Lachnospiraceae bacterium]